MIRVSSSYQFPLILAAVPLPNRLRLVGVPISSPSSPDFHLGPDLLRRGVWGGITYCGFGIGIGVGYGVGSVFDR